MEFSLDQRTAALGVGEFAGFVIGPHDSSDGPQGLWRAQLGTHWHQQLRAQVADVPTAQFEVVINGQVFHRGWTLMLSGRIDQILPGKTGPVLREIKTVTRPLPADETELRAEYPEYFAQLATYLALRAIAEPSSKPQGELVFVEVDTGLSQTIEFSPADENVFRVQLERVAEFLDLRLRSRERLQTLRFSPAFAELRPGQETVQAELTTALRSRPIILLEAPTGFGKTGVVLECALQQMHEGRFERLVYLTSKATGQLHVAETLARMTALPAGGTGVMTWQVRNKREHCIHTKYHCSRDVCPHLVDLERKWPRSSLSRFYLFNNELRDIDTLRAAGRSASICPYEITRAALAFNDAWIGDYNYVFSPASRGLFDNQPGFDPARSLLVIDEAHNLPSRVADVYSRRFTAALASEVAGELHRNRVPTKLAQAWDHWTHFLSQLSTTDNLALAEEDDARHLMEIVAGLISTTPLDSTALGPEIMEQLWQLPAFADELSNVTVPRLWWSPQPGELAATCLDAAAAIGPTLRSFGAAILVSATLTPTDTFATACGLDNTPNLEPELPASNPERLGRLNKRDTRHLYTQLTSGAELLKIDEAAANSTPALVQAHAPWRDHAYDVAIDLRVDTSYQQRTRHHATTAATVAKLHAAARGPCAVFFSSYRYAEAIQNTLRDSGALLRVALQPRLPDLAAQNAWVEASMAGADVLFLVLGSSFAEGIDLLGGRLSHAMVVGPALPEVNPVQKARLAEVAPLGRDEAFRRVYQAPGIQKVNQALGRLVRAPGQQAKVLLHCRRFAEPSYTRLLAPEYRKGIQVGSDEALATWLDRP
ncbi:MAG: helicase [Verrucomicrobia bacterium]|nr:helicase [Verrucomicrobiota bacterium]